MTFTLENWAPKFIPLDQERIPREIIDNKDWNDAFNLLRSQGNWNSETLEKLINTGDISVKIAEFARNSALLDGQPKSYFAARNNVLGLDENTFKPNSAYRPLFKEQPTNKGYVDDIFDEYTVKYASGIVFKAVYTTYLEFIEKHPTGENGDAYLVADHVYVWDHLIGAWHDGGPLTGPKGDPGMGVPPGGAVGQFLTKSSLEDYKVEWTNYEVDLRPYVKSSSKNIYTGATAPSGPQINDIWLKTA